MKKRILKTIAMLTVVVMMGTGVAGCSGKKKEINLGAQNVNEMVILINMAKLMIEDQTDYDVTINTEFNGSAILHQAMTQDEIDLYPTWTGTQLTGILRYEGENMSQDDTYNYVKDRFDEQYNMTWSAPLGFNNTYAFVVKDEVAQEYNLEKCSDLAEYAPEWTLAGDENFDTRSDAYPGWSEAYGIEFDEVINLQYGIIYRAIGAGEVDVAAAYSTDARIKQLGLTILEDDKEFFPAYSGAYVLSKSLMEDYPDVLEVVNQLEGLIDTEQMVDLNYQYDNGEDPDAIAETFLKEVGLLE